MLGRRLTLQKRSLSEWLRAEVAYAASCGRESTLGHLEYFQINPMASYGHEILCLRHKSMPKIGILVSDQMDLDTRSKIYIGTNGSPFSIVCLCCSEKHYRRKELQKILQKNAVQYILARNAAQYYATSDDIDPAHRIPVLEAEDKNAYFGLMPKEYQGMTYVDLYGQVYGKEAPQVVHSTFKIYQD